MTRFTSIPRTPAVATDRDTIWRAVCDAVNAALETRPNLRNSMSSSGRQALAFEIAAETARRIEAVPERRWTGTMGHPCWVCGCSYRRHGADGEKCPDVAAEAAQMEVR